MIAPPRVLYDGWALTYAPSSPAAFHLLALLHALPPGVDAQVAVPGPCRPLLPAGATLLTRSTPDTSRARLAWEQRTLPRLAQSSGAALLHLFGLHPPLSSPVPVVASPADVDLPPLRLGQVAERLRAALVAGAQASFRGLFWPDDLDPPGGSIPAYRLPALAHPAFSAPRAGPTGGIDGAVLYHGPADRPSLLRLLDGWGWVSGVIGEYNPLVLAGLTPAENQLLDQLVAAGGFGGSVQTASAETPSDWAALYAAAALIVHPAAAPIWDGPVSSALAAGKPLVAWDEPRTAQRVGGAAYLTPPGDSRALGAAISTLVVEEEMAANLAARASQRAAEWKSPAFGARLQSAYHAILSR